MSNTLRLVPHVHWIAVEDANYTVPYVEDILRRTMHSYTYVAARTPEGYPKRGWYQRTTALQLLRNNTVSVMKNYKEGVVYFGDDDNAYDTRLFTDYIRKVKKLGMWAVGLSGGTPVESPEVMNGTVVGYKVKWGPKRKFAVDMAGFAINLNFILKFVQKKLFKPVQFKQWHDFSTTAVFGKSCRSGFGAPEPCFLEDMGFSQDDIEPFGLDEEMAPKVCQ
uniref:Galactosylgalactosylxylosylprotein 3-beta-glucuronosyltransferase n=1 Tax=Haemonchus contortus TaxID=6289 RepID=W6NBS8_HAECO